MKRHRLLTVWLMVALLGVLGCGLLPTSGGEPEIEFASREDVVESGACTVLEWEVRGAGDYPVFLDGEEVDPSGWEEVCPEETTGYKLVVGAPGGPFEERVTIQVVVGPGASPTAARPPTAAPQPPTITPVPSTATPRPPTATPLPPTAAPPPPQPPSITYFRANGTAGSITVNAGTTVTLSWEWQRVSEGYLDPGNIAMACPAMPCTYQVTPAATTTYTLRAVNAAGTDTKTVTVNVTSPLTFTFSPTSGNPGSEVELYLSRPVEGVTVYFGGRVLPKRVLDGGSRLRVTIPGDASSDYFELQWDGQSVRASQQFTVTAPSTTLILHNNTGVTIWYVYISPCTDATWGDDKLGSDVVPAGATYNWTVDPGCYDLKAEDSNHNALHQQFDVNIVGTYHWYAQ
jgi:hypothetical protein